LGVVLIGGATAAALIALAIVYGRPKPATLQPPRADHRVG
jgi:hypothetical protein